MADRYAPFAELVRNRLAVAETSALLNRRELLDGEFDEQQVTPSRRLRLAAVEAQAVLAQQDHAAAELAVHSMLNQMISLAQAAPWWSTQADAAIAETVDYAAGNHDVGSALAQRCWDWYRSARASFVALGTDLVNLPADEYETLCGRMNQAEAEWLACWNDWHGTRHEGKNA